MGFHSYQTNFTGGVLSPRMFSRVDFNKYANGVETLENGVVLVTGGASRRAGTQYIAKAKSTSAFQPSAFQASAFQTGNNDSVVLRDFVFNTDDAMVLEWGPGYIRFFKNREQVYGSSDGSDLMTNGAFASDVGSWVLQQDNGGTVAWEAPGQALLTNGAAGVAGISQTISGLVPGDRYVTTFTVDSGNIRFDIGSTIGAGDVYTKTTLAPGRYRLVFIPSTTSVIINFVGFGASNVARIDDVTMFSAIELELETTYEADEIRSLRFAQSADTMYIAHRSHPPRKLTRLSDTLWTLQDVVFNVPPTEEIPLTPAASLTPAATTGTGIVFTADSSVFLAADVGRQIKSRGGVAVITAQGGTTATADIIQAFLSTSPIGAGEWTLDASPFAQVTLGAAGAVNTYTTATLAAAGFRATDLGAFLHVNDWIVEITQVTSNTVAQVKIMKAADPAQLVAISGAWTLEFDSWSATNGYPECVGFFEQRLVFSKGQDYWGSTIGDFEDFGRGPNDDDSYRASIVSGQVDVIRWMKSMDFILVGTIGNEYKLDAGDGLTITPNNPAKAALQSSWGSDPEPDAIRAGAAVIFLQRGRLQIRELGKAFEAGLDAFQAADLTILATHLFQSGVTEMARTSSPASYLLSVLGSGDMAVATYERPEQVVAWSKFTTDGLYKSVCVIPNKCGSGDEVWSLVERDIDGRRDLFIEVFDGQLNTDCALVHEDEGNPATGLAGLTHLEAEEVDVVRTTQSSFQANCFQRSMIQSVRASYAQDTVASGFVAISPEADRVEVGLHYDTTIKTLRIEMGSQTGTAHFRAKRTNTIYVRFLCTRGVGVYVDDELVSLSNTLEVFDWSKQANLGWNRDGQVTIRQTHPMPMTVLGISYAYQIDDGDAPVGDADN